MTLEEINEQIRVLEAKKKTLVSKEQEDDIKYIESLEWTKSCNGNVVRLGSQIVVRLGSQIYGEAQYQIYLNNEVNAKPLPRLDRDVCLGKTYYSYPKVNTTLYVTQSSPSLHFYKAKDLIEFLTENNFNHLSYDEEWFHIMKLIYDKQNKTPEY